MKYYGTFGQGHEHPLPDYMKDNPGIEKYVSRKGNIPWKNFYVEVFADTWERAFMIMHDNYGSRWSNLYETHEFDKSFFPLGVLTQLGTTTPEDEANEIIEKIYEQRTNNRKIEGARDSINELLSQE